MNVLKSHAPAAVLGGICSVYLAPRTAQGAIWEIQNIVGERTFMNVLKSHAPAAVLGGICSVYLAPRTAQGATWEIQNIVGE